MILTLRNQKGGGELLDIGHATIERVRQRFVEQEIESARLSARAVIVVVRK